MSEGNITPKQKEILEYIKDQYFNKRLSTGSS